MSRISGTRIAVVSRCAWTLYNFRAGLIRALVREGAEVITGGAGGDGYENKVKRLGVSFFDLPVDKRGINPVADLRLISTLYRWYRAEHPNIVHHFTIKPVIYGSIAGKLARIPIIINTVTGLGYVFTDQDRGWLTMLVRAMYQGAFSASDHVFFQNLEDREFFGRYNNRLSGKVSVLPGSGVDCDLFSPRQELTKTREDGTNFLMVSRVLKDKGVYEFVEAGRLVKKLYPDTTLKLLGRRDERNPSVVSMKDLEQWHAEGILEWLGEVEDVRPFLAEADVVVLPSYREGTPRSLLEAAAMQKPLIATDVPGCREIVIQGKTGLLVQPKDSKGLARAMIKMIENPLMRLQMGREGRRKVEKEFDETIVIEKVLDTYKGLLETKKDMRGRV